jgi:IS605 OrfB family transposase
VYVAERGRLEREEREELYRRFRELYPHLPAQLVQQAMNQGVEVGKSFLEARRDGRVHKPRPEVRRVSIRFAKDSWSYRRAVGSAAPARLAPSLPGGRREVWIKPHRRFWLYWWRKLAGEVELASTLIVKRKRGRWYAIFAFDVQPRGEPPTEAAAFDVNENSVAVARVSLLATVDRVASWNRQYINPAVYSIRTDFGRLAERYERIRNAKLEELRGKYPFAGRDGEERAQNVADTREFRRFAGRLRERRRKEGRVKQVAREVARSPAVIITEDLGKNPQGEMIGIKGKKAKKDVKKVKRKELRHRIKQIPFRKPMRAVEDKAAERGSVVVYVSPYRNSKVCPIHFALLRDNGGWHTLWCPHGHDVDRDHAAVLNMLWKATPAGWMKAVWWNLKCKEAGGKGGREEGESHHSAANRVRRLDLAQGPPGRRQMARGAGPAASMTPAGGADEGGARAPPRGAGTPRPRGGGQLKYAGPII